MQKALAAHNAALAAGRTKRDDEQKRQAEQRAACVKACDELQKAAIPAAVAPIGYEWRVVLVPAAAYGQKRQARVPQGWHGDRPPRVCLRLEVTRWARRSRADPSSAARDHRPGPSRVPQPRPGPGGSNPKGGAMNRGLRNE